jgi:hypothetical protein
MELGAVILQSLQRLALDGWSSLPGNGKGFPAPPRPDWLWVYSAFYPICTGALFSDLNRLEREADLTAQEWCCPTTLPHTCMVKAVKSLLSVQEVPVILVVPSSRNFLHFMKSKFNFRIQENQPITGKLILTIEGNMHQMHNHVLSFCTVGCNVILLRSHVSWGTR